MTLSHPNSYFQAFVQVEASVTDFHCLRMKNNYQKTKTTTKCTWPLTVCHVDMAKHFSLISALYMLLTLDI